MSLCKYKDMFGAPGTGVHSIRVANIAIVDVILTLLAAWGISWWLELNFFAVAFILFVIGVIVHRVFCVETTVDKFFFS